jgi:hypothetical protein
LKSTPKSSSWRIRILNKWQYFGKNIRIDV